MKRKEIKQNKISRLLQSLKRKQGVTLVELIVAFALIGLFAAGCSRMIAVSLKTYHQIRGLNDAKQVSDTVMDKICGEIQGAQVGSVKGTGEGLDRTLEIYANGTVIEFYDRTGSHICITTTSSRDNIKNGTAGAQGDTAGINQMLIYYFPMKYKAVDWTYDDAVYMGFEVESLHFSLAGTGEAYQDYPKNIVKVELTLKSSRHGTHKSTRYVECYNFISQQDLDKIIER